MVFKVSVRVHKNYWNRKDRLNEANVSSYAIMYTVLKTEITKAEMYKYEGVGVEVGQ